MSEDKKKEIEPEKQVSEEKDFAVSETWAQDIIEDMDDFIEKIPYPETKDYVKKVLKSYWNYCNIYN